MKSKVCGLKYPENINQIIQLQPDYVGFIFYKESKRNIELNNLESIVIDIPKHIKKVGVFVNESVEYVIEKHEKYKLDYIQLHGDENIDYCRQLQNHSINIIKAFSVDDDFDFEISLPYSKYCNYFLFDTKSNYRGGNGISFNWKILNKYTGTTSFFLSGGIGIENLDEALSIKHKKIEAIDLNSKLETSIGLKDIELTKNCINKITNKKNHEHTTK